MRWSLLFAEEPFFIFIQVAGRNGLSPIMSQIAKDYQQVSPGFGLSPSFVNSTSTPLEDRNRDEHFFDLFRRDGMLSDMVDALKRPFKVVDSHERSRTVIIHVTLPSVALRW